MSALRALFVWALVVCLSPLATLARPLRAASECSHGQTCCRTKRHGCCQKHSPDAWQAACQAQCQKPKAERPGVAVSAEPPADVVVALVVSLNVPAPQAGFSAYFTPHLLQRPPPANA